MSTRPESTHDDATTTRTTAPTDFSTDATSATGEGATSTDDATPATDDGLSPFDGPSWTDRCERQFATDDAGRLRNLADDQNQAMHDGI